MYVMAYFALGHDIGIFIWIKIANQDLEKEMEWL